MAMISTPFPAEETVEKPPPGQFSLPAQESQVLKEPSSPAPQEDPQPVRTASAEPSVRSDEPDGSESPAPESEPEIQTDTREVSAPLPPPPLVYVPGPMSSAQVSAYNSSLQGFLAARLSAVTRAMVARDRPDPEEEQRAWEVVEAATPLDRIRAFYPNFANVFHLIVKIIYRELKINGYSYEFVRDLKSRQRNPEHMSLDAILIEAGASPREMKEKFASNPQEREDLEAYILLAAVLLIKTFKPDPWTEKYKTISEFLEAYPELSDEHDKDTLISLQLFANVMVNVLRYINGKGNQQRLLTLVACLSEGPQHSRYITGGAQSKKTARRVMIYRRESNTHKISRPRRSRERRAEQADDANTSKKMRQGETATASGLPSTSTTDTTTASSIFNPALAAIKREPGLTLSQLARPGLPMHLHLHRPASETLAGSVTAAQAAVAAALNALREREAAQFAQAQAQAAQAQAAQAQAAQAQAAQAQAAQAAAQASQRSDSSATTTASQNGATAAAVSGVAASGAAPVLTPVATTSTTTSASASVSASPATTTVAAPATSASTAAQQQREMTPLELLYASAQKMQASEPPIPSSKKRPFSAAPSQALASPAAKQSHTAASERPTAGEGAAAAANSNSQPPEPHPHPAMAAMPQFVYPHPLGPAAYPMPAPMMPMQRDGQPAAAPMPYPAGMPIMAYSADPRLYEEQRRQMAAAYPMPFMPFHPPPPGEGAAAAAPHPVMYGPPMMMPYPMPAPPMPAQDGSGVKAEAAHPAMHPYFAYSPMMPAYIMPPPPTSAAMATPMGAPMYAQPADASARSEQPDGSNLLSASNAESMDTVNALLSLSASGNSSATASK